MTEQQKTRSRLTMIRHAQDVSHNVSKTSGKFGVSRTTFYRWYHRFQSYGIDGLRDRPTRQPIISNGGGANHNGDYTQALKELAILILKQVG